ncbi:MAG: imidazole glycerol phosphate synthase subunit HisH [Granulosicoccus sp.]
MQQIVVIDYGMGNLRSVSKAIEHVAPDDSVLVTRDPDVIRSADKIVCPGQGAAADCMQALRDSQLDATVREAFGNQPFLGICMGYQVLFDDSEENDGVSCLGCISGTVKRFARPLLDLSGARLKVPHMGWSEVIQKGAHPLWHGIEQDSRFYFAHSYYCVPQDHSLITGLCRYGNEFAASVARENLFACQFHPEKSAVAGLQLLKNFVHWRVG